MSRIPALADAPEQPVALDHVLHGERRRAGDRVAEVGVAVLEEAAAPRHRVDDPFLGQHGADRLVAAAQPLRDHQEVGHDTVLLAGVQRAGAAHPAHHLVQDQQAPVPVADLAHRLEVPGHRRQHAGRRAADGLGDERDHLVRADPLHRRVELGGEPRSVGLRGLVVPLLAVGVAGRDVLDVDQAAARTAGGATRCRRRRARPACCRGSSAAAR